MKETIKALRENHNYSQSYLASYLKISRQMYIKYELGEVEPPVKVVVALSKLYKVSYSQIIDNTFNPNKETFSYKINQEETLCVAAPSPVYSGITNNYDNQLQTLISLLKNLSEDSLISVATFVKMLESEQIIANTKSQKSKKAFFDLAGKIKLDLDSITEFREESLI